MKRCLTVVMTLLLLLLTGLNIGLWLRTHNPAEIRTQFDAEQVLYIEQLDTSLTHQRSYPDITDRESIQLICDVYSTTERAPYGRLVFHMTDGDTVTVDNPYAMLLAIDGVWYYAS